MATIRDFTVEPLENVRSQDEVKTVVRLIECDGEKFVQIDTYGRADREFPGKLSQTVRLNEDAFRKLVALGDSHF